MVSSEPAVNVEQLVSSSRRKHTIITRRPDKSRYARLDRPNLEVSSEPAEHDTILSSTSKNSLTEGSVIWACHIVPSAAARICGCLGSLRKQCE